MPFQKIMSVRAFKNTLLTLSVLSSFNLLAQVQVIHAGTLLKVAGKKPLVEQTLVIENN